jgi:hypothetical protein
VQVKEPDGRKIVTDKSLIVATRVPYAKYVSELRNFAGFSRETIEKMKAGLTRYLAVKS